MKEGGLLDKLINKAQLPEMEITISRESLISLGVMLFITVTALLIVQAILKSVTQGR